MAKKSEMELAKERTQEAINKTNSKIEELGNRSGSLYDNLNSIQGLFDNIRNVPDKTRLEYQKLENIRHNWKEQAEKIDNDFKKAAAKDAGAGAAGAAAGVAVAALGPSAAMGVATTFGVASTGTAISSLSGAAATNAALAWLGGGTIAAGGGGMAAGNAFLALADPIGWAIAGVAILASGVFLWKSISDKKRLEKIFISERDVKSYELAIIELNERIIRIDDENKRLTQAIKRIMTFGEDYSKMTEEQQCSLGTYVNLMSSATQLLVNPIIGLCPKYTAYDYDRFIADADKKVDGYLYQIFKEPAISLANLLYRIQLDDKDKKIIWKSLRSNKELLMSLDIDKKAFTEEIIEVVEEVLEYHYSLIPYV